MAVFDRPYESLEELHEAELEHLKIMVDSGVRIAVPAAMAYCAKHRLSPPRWLVIESANMLGDYLSGNLPKERGRSSGIVNRYRQDTIDRERWEAVIEVRENRDRLREEIKKLRALPGRRARDILDECTKLLDWVGTNNDAAFECASLLLARTPAKGGPDAIRTSYRNVERNMRNPATAMRYCILDPQFLRLIGAEIAQPASQGKKIVPLYDLTG
jgi:hypothetical protein